MQRSLAERPSCPLWVNNGHRCQVKESVLPPKADIDQPGCDVRFVPKADIRGLFDQLVGAGKKRRR
jgi:hypothetical protein